MSRLMKKMLQMLTTFLNLLEKLKLTWSKTIPLQKTTMWKSSQDGVNP
jgi:hypothetical protein